MKLILIIAAVFAASTLALADGGLYDRYEGLGPALTLQDPDPLPEPFTFETVFSIKDRVYELSRVVHREQRTRHGMFVMTSGAGFALDNGRAVISPVGFGWFGEIDTGWLILTGGVSAELIIEQGERADLLVAASVGFRF